MSIYCKLICLCSKHIIEKKCIIQIPFKLNFRNFVSSSPISSFFFFFFFLSFFSFFLVACTRLYNLLCPSVGWLVTLYFFYDFYIWTSLLLPKWSSDLKYGPCSPARDFGSRVSGLVLLERKKEREKE